MNLNPQRIEALMTRRPDFATQDDSAAFWFGDQGGMAWVGRYSGASPWERHPAGDEYLYVVEGSVDVVVLTDSDEHRARLEAGCFFVVPRGLWHRQIGNGTMTQIGATPGRTEHSELPDPRQAVR